MLTVVVCQVSRGQNVFSTCLPPVANGKTLTIVCVNVFCYAQSQKSPSTILIVLRKGESELTNAPIHMIHSKFTKPGQKWHSPSTDPVASMLPACF
jgi:hypothetical protein